MLDIYNIPVSLTPRASTRIRVVNVVKLALQRDNAKRFLLRLSNPSQPSSSFSSSKKKKKLRKNSSTRATSSITTNYSNGVSDPPAAPVRGNEEMRVNYEEPIGHAEVLRERMLIQDSLCSRRSSVASVASVQSRASTEVPLPTLANEKIIASGSGITVSLAQAEPVLFLEGADSQDNPKAAMLRGHMRIKVTKAAKIKKVYLSFKGQLNSSWPEGIPGRKSQYHDNRGIMNHTWPFFDAQFANAEYNYGAHVVYNPLPRKSKETVSTVDILAKSSSTSLDRLPKELRRLSLQHTPSRSYGKDESSYGGQTVAQKGYKVFRPGEYLYNFELPIDARLPETIKTDYASVKYSLEASVERSGVFRPNLLGSKEVLVVRTPSQNSLEQVEPIAISREWEDQLHYDIIISGKSVPLGAKIPIAFKLTPLAKVACHRVKVYVTESIQQWTAGKTAHRMDSTKQLLLFEKRADQPSTSTYPGGVVRVTAGGGISWDNRAAAAAGEEVVNPQNTSLLGEFESDFGTGPTEMEFEVPLPTCPLMKDKDPSQRLHADSKYESIEINHWIKIVLRLSRPDDSHPRKRRHFEISIDSPFHILSCLATTGNIYLPSYSSPSSFSVEEYECGCPGAQPTPKAPSRTNSSAMEDSNMLVTVSENPALVPPLGFDLRRPEEVDLPPSTLNSSNSPRHSNTRRTATDRTHVNPPDAPNRPMHFLRCPSFAPPPFDELPPPPPPLMTPPPDYGSVVPSTSDPRAGLLDYFERLHHAEQEYDEGTRGNARVDIPLTPGGRVHRSLEIPRELVRVDPIAE